MEQPTNLAHTEAPLHNQAPQHGSNKPPTKMSWLYLLLVILAAAAVFGLVWWFALAADQQNTQTQQNLPSYEGQKKSTETPKLDAEVVLNGRDHVWEIAFLPTKEMLFTERSGTLSMLKDGNVSVVNKFDDVYSFGEAGLLGLVVDPNFGTNHYVYTCLDSKLGTPSPSIRVARLTLKTDLSGVDARTDIITDIPANGSGRHSGCRLQFGPDSYLWVGTGDTGIGDTSIQPKSLGGKVLRVDHDGKAAPGNLGGEFDARIYSYGHRNIQGLAFYKTPVNGVIGVNIEHGSNVDDEVNPLVKGNFGWAPAPVGYVEDGVPMTDKARFPDAIDAIWSSGNPTQAPSGATFMKGRQWKAWDGALAVSVLKASHLKILTLQNNKVIKEQKVFEGTFGRLRTAVQGPDGDLYISTDNGSTDKIIRITPN